MNTTLRKALSCILAATMLVSLAACKSKNKETGIKVSETDPYYSVKEIEIYKAGNINDSVYVSSVLDLGDKIGIQMEIYKYSDVYYEEIPRVSEEVIYEEKVEEPDSPESAADDVAADEETGDTTVADETVPSDEEIIPEETGEEPIIDDGSYEDMNQRLFLMFDLDGNKVGEINLNDVLNENEYVLSLKADAQGNLLMIMQSYDPETGLQTNSIVTLDMTGKEIKPRVDFKFDEGTWPGTFIFDSAGNVYVSTYGEMDSKSKVTVFDSTGKKLFDVDVENMSDAMYLIDGVVYVTSYGTGDDFTYLFYPIDLQTKKPGAPIDMASITMGQPVFAEDGIYINRSGGVYTYDMATAEQTQILSWNDTDLDLSTFSYGSMVPVSKEKMIIIGQSYGYPMVQGSTEPTPVKMAILTKEATNPNAGKELLIIAGLDIFTDSSITSQIYQFNKSSTEYRVEIKDYAEDFNYVDYYSDPDPNAYSKAYAELSEAMYLDMINGEGPDIIITGYNMNSLERFEAKGLLADLYELGTKDGTFNKADFVQSVLSVYESDGKLYQFPLNFTLRGLVGPVRLIGERTGWTVEQFSEMVNALPEGVLPLVNVNQSTLLSACLNASMDSFVDYTKNEVNFDNDEFYKLLDLAKTYGSDDDAEQAIPDGAYYEKEDGSYYVDPYELMSTGKLALTEAYVYGASSVSQFRYDFGENVSFVGYPSANKSGLSCLVSQSFAISAESPNQDAAWDFMKGFIGEEYQNNSYNGIPILQAALDKQLDLALHPVEQEGMYKDMYYGYEVTQEDADKYIELINAVSSKTEGEEQILAIIMEEVPAYFNGQKTEQDVSAIIQNRVKTFVNEKS
jgi:ABC-type glycerol-3-phosphate transport system substrate-binding protein